MPRWHLCFQCILVVLAAQAQLTTSAREKGEEEAKDQDFVDCFLPSLATMNR